jgi:hypothetical protein
VKSFFILLLSLNLFAGDLITSEREDKTISDLIGNLKKDAWHRGHDNIEVESELFDGLRFERFLEKEMPHIEEVLVDEDITNFKNCLISESCKLYKINVSSEYYGGYGFDYHFITYDSLSGDVKIETFSGYNE